MILLIEIRYIYINVLVSNILKLPEPFRMAVKNS